MLSMHMILIDDINALNAHEFEQAHGVGDRQGSLACCSPWGCKELDTTKQQQQITVNFWVHPTVTRRRA